MELRKARAVLPQLRFVDSTDSTNLSLQREYASLADFSALAAAEQTGGQGRAGRNWVSDAGASISLSLLLRPSRPEIASLITLLMASSARQAISELYPSLTVSIKWPNDLLIEDRKLAGVLATVNPDQSVVVGIGINLARQSAPDTAVALGEFVTADFDSVLAAVLLKLQENWQRLQADAETNWLIEDIRANCSTLGAEIRAELVTGESIVGRATDITKDGRLIVQADQEHVLSAADVWHIRR
jgi:BirA family biotin operon repressor/biotin-[acetyl-CoA-carboxylase] ligase